MLAMKKQLVQEQLVHSVRFVNTAICLLYNYRGGGVVDYSHNNYTVNRSNENF